MTDENDQGADQPLVSQDQKNDKKSQSKYHDDATNFSIKDNSKITNGLVQQRGCTNFFCLLVFIAFFGALGFVSFQSYKAGNMNKIMAPIDSQNRFCGINEGVENYPYLYFYDLATTDTKTFLRSGICVKYCPNEASWLNCDDNDAKCNELNENKQNTYKTDLFVSYCLPNMKSLKTTHPNEYEHIKYSIDEMKSKFVSMLNSQIGSLFKDLYLSSRAVMWSCMLSFVWCIFFIYMMSYFAESIAWIVIVLVQLGLPIASGLSLYKWNDLKSKQTNDTKDTETLLLTIGIICGVLAVVYLMMVCCFFKSLKIAIDVIDASADFLAATKRVILVPILYFFVNMIAIMIWMPATIAILSKGFDDITPDSSFPQLKNISYTKDEKVKNEVTILFVLMLFGILWFIAYQKAKVGFIAMVSASSYYFSSDKDKEGQATVSTGFKFAYLFHSGSLCLGSFIIALIQLIRIIFYYVAKKAAKASGNNKVIEIIIKCGECYLSCLESICDYINDSAYAYMAVSGDSFCTSAWNGFLLNIKHGAKFAFANFLANMFIFIGKAAIVVLNCFTVFLIMQHVTHDLEELDSPAVPIGFVALVTYMAANIFLGLFDEAVLALLTCLCIDTDMNGTPKYGPPTFYDDVKFFGGNKNKNVDEEDKDKEIDVERANSIS